MIRAWVAEETSDRALGDLLQMNDRLLALVSQWQAVSEELQAQRQRRVGPLTQPFLCSKGCAQLMRAAQRCVCCLHQRQLLP